MAKWVVNFPWEEYKINNIFAQKCSKGTGHYFRKKSVLKIEDNKKMSMTKNIMLKIKILFNAFFKKDSDDF